MMKTKNIFVTAVLLGCFIGAAAQDVTVLHMKDGTTKRYQNGLKQSTSIDFYGYTPSNFNYTSHETTVHENGYTANWGVNQVLKRNGEYVVGLLWYDNIPNNFKAQHGVCFGTEAGLTVDNSLMKVYASDAKVLLNQSTYNMSHLSDGHYHYMWIGASKSNSAMMYFFQNELETPDTLVNYITTSLEKGKTYYYRLFSEGKVLEGGQEKTVVLYGDECSFRVPRVMDDYGYFAYPCATDEALAAFATAHLDTLAVPSWKQLEPLWNKWRAADEGKDFDLSTYITTEQFDDGTGYRLNRIPDEFYTWAANREIVIDPFDVADISKIYDSNSQDSIYSVTLDSITNVDPKWGVPGGKYVRFEPVLTSVNHSITYRSPGVMAGVRYKLQLNFAPETNEDAAPDSTCFLPTKIRVYTIENGTATRIELPAGDNKGTAVIPATETTTIEVENFSTATMGLDMYYNTMVLNSELRKGLYNRILRVAEIRLIPMKNE